MNGRAVLVVFAKAPRPGLVKTRMSPPLSSQDAAELYGHLLDDVLAASRDFGRALGVELVVAVHPPEGLSEIAQRAPQAFRVVAQRGRDLGARMTWAVAEQAAAGASLILLRGSDSPALSGDTVASALEQLDESDLVVSPDLDGGYNLVGLRAPIAGLFDHPMSTTSALQDTLANADVLGLRTRILESGFDLDTVEDLPQLARVRRRGAAPLCPRTLAYLDAHDWWGRGGE